MKTDVTVSGNGRASAPLPAARPKRNRRLIWLLVSAAVLLVALIAVYVRIRAANSVSYITSAVTRTSLVQTVTATGTVNPQNTILVGTQVSGTILEQDADFDSMVAKGQVLTRLDPTSYRAALDNAQAAEGQAQSTWAASIATGAEAADNVDAARAALATARSQVAKAKAALDLANVTLKRDKALIGPGYIAQTQYDTDAANQVAAVSAYQSALIAVPQAQAQLASAQASQAAAQSSMAASLHAVDVQRANVATAQYNLDNTVIRASVKGMVIARNITIGQTVAASFQTPTLFTLGQDLAKMEVDVSVGEPDIGGIRAGDIADFTVLAYPNRTFHGYVYQVRQNPTTINNVVTYDTVVYVDNKDGALYPGMTANASIHVAKVQNALVVPITALQYTPPQQAQVAQQRVVAGAVATSPWGATEASLTRTIVAGRNGRLFVMRNGQLTLVRVRVLLVSGTDAAVAPIAPATLNVGDATAISDSRTLMAQEQGAASSALTRPSQQPLSRPGGSNH
ncbi:MAG TPA: efflux RND transporter periplasmic adaptor subunit [Candidatus Acidoferrales bacterium]|nr:efflux RND transporter periplasmic adaptor subunit [Candidatus Acidoferrales bacterium]